MVCKPGRSDPSVIQDECFRQPIGILVPNQLPTANGKLSLGESVELHRIGPTRVHLEEVGKLDIGPEFQQHLIFYHDCMVNRQVTSFIVRCWAQTFSATQLCETDEHLTILDLCLQVAGILGEK